MPANRELSALKRMLNLGKKYGKVGDVPKITLLKEKNTRKGFFEYKEFVAVREALPPNSEVLLLSPIKPDGVWMRL